MKLKSHSGAKKRFKITSTGKMVFRKPCKKHLLINKSKRQKATGQSGMALHKTDEYRIRRLLPQSF